MMDIRTFCASMLLLIPCTVTDVRRKTIPTFYVLAFAAAAAALNRLFGWKTWVQMGLGLLPGVFLLIAAAVSKEKIGYGDGILFLALGILCGAQTAVTMLFASLLISLVTGGVYLLLSKRPAGTPLPFVPAVTAAVLIMFIMSVL